jgi:hypothetical protein
MVTLGFVACCGKKLAHPAPAKKLYQSDLFRKSRAYVEQHCDDWFILSALHGLVHPDKVIEPYDVTLERMSRLDNLVWTADVMIDVAGLRIDRGYAECIVLAGSRYRKAFDGIPHKAPLAGLGIGQQLAWLKGALCN